MTKFMRLSLYLFVLSVFIILFDMRERDADMDSRCAYISSYLLTFEFDTVSYAFIEK